MVYDSNTYQQDERKATCFVSYWIVCSKEAQPPYKLKVTTHHFGSLEFAEY